MTRTDLTTRVMMTTAGTVGLLAVAAASLGRPRAGVGLLAAGVITIANFVWLARGVAGAVAAGNGRRARVAWGLAAGGRLAALLAAIAVVLASGLADPVALVAGLAVLPVATVVQGLRAVRAGAGS